MMQDDGLAHWRIGQEPYYLEVGSECSLFSAACKSRAPILLKGPTGCGKTRFVEHMAWRLGRPVVTIACNEDTSTGDLIGRWLLVNGETRWQDGPLTLAARHGAICYLDEMAEARPETLVVIHPLTDTRRVLLLAGCDEVISAHPDFALVASYNPGAGSVSLKQSTRQRFCALNFEYLPADREAQAVAHEGGVSLDTANTLVALAHRCRRLAGHSLEEGASTRMLIRSAELMTQGIDPVSACRMALAAPLSDDLDTLQALDAAIEAAF